MGRPCRGDPTPDPCQRVPPRCVPGPLFSFCLFWGLIGMVLHGAHVLIPRLFGHPRDLLSEWVYFWSCLCHRRSAIRSVTSARATVCGRPPLGLQSSPSSQLLSTCSCGPRPGPHPAALGHHDPARARIDTESSGFGPFVGGLISPSSRTCPKLTWVAARVRMSAHAMWWSPAPRSVGAGSSLRLFTRECDTAVSPLSAHVGLRLEGDLLGHVVVLGLIRRETAAVCHRRRGMLCPRQQRECVSVCECG